MKTLCIGTLAIAFLIYARCHGDEPVRDLQWKSPNGTHAVVAKPNSNRSIVDNQLDVFTVSNGGDLVPFKEVPFVGSGKHKYAGSSWLRAAKCTWLKETVAVFRSSSNIAIMDIVSREILLNNRFEFVAKEPGEDCWALLKYRSVDRHLEQLPLDYHDKVLIVNLRDDSFRSIVRNTAAQQAGDLPSIELEGVAVTEPLWSFKGNEFLINVAVGDEVYAYIFYISLKMRDRLNLKMILPMDRKTSLKLDPETRKLVISRLLSVASEDLVEEFRLKKK